jgi:hypothetical protein
VIVALVSLKVSCPASKLTVRWFSSPVAAVKTYAVPALTVAACADPPPAIPSAVIRTSTRRGANVLRSFHTWDSVFT